MAWISITAGIIAVLSVNLPRHYQGGKLPKWYLRISMTLAGIYFIYVGLHRLGIGRLE
jgi:hypothetical protein